VNGFPQETTHHDFAPSVRHLPRFDDGWIVPATRDELVEQLSSMSLLQRRLARRNFSAFMEYCFYDERTGIPFEQQWFHDQWATAMDTEDRLLIIAPRDHGKTSQIVGRTLFELGRDPNARIKIACASDGRAKERLYEVVQHVLYNPRVLEVFPHLRPSQHGEWSKHKVVVERPARYKDASVEAIGITSTATGGRCDILIADDVVDRRNSLSFPALREQIKQAWASDWTNLLEPDSKIWYICTLWHKDDLSHRLMTNEAYRTMFYAVPKDFGALWPAKWNTEALYARYKEIGSVEFNRAFRNEAVDIENAVVQPTWIRYSDLRTNEDFVGRLGEMVFFTSYDTAGTPSGRAEQDYAANVVVAVDAVRRKVYVINASRYRATVQEQAKRVIRDARKYEPFRALIEKASQAAVDEWVLNEAPELAGIVEAVKPKNLSKAQRLLGVTPLLEDGTVVFDKKLDPDGEGWKPGRGSLVDELVDFPFAKHDDLVDAFSQALHAVRRYLLDWGADGGENSIDVTIGRGTENREYLL